jgi:uncharacterized membrane protein YeaQ/YmgE (transglycosylase-associated protein family)
MNSTNHINGLALNVSSHTLLVWILIGLVAGYITGKLMRGAGFGPILDIVVGIVGALIGGFIMIHLGYAGSGGFFYTVFVAVIGAVLLTFLLRLVTGGRSGRF